VAEFIRQNLDGHIALQLSVARSIDLSHAAFLRGTLSLWALWERFRLVQRKDEHVAGVL
jgi:hypothetical protein